MKLHKMISALALAGVCLFSQGQLRAAEQKSPVGIVNFASCMTESRYGKQEQESFESLKKQMTSLLEDTEKQLNDIATKLNDSEYVDGLSPDAEEELKNKFRALSEDMNRYQNQYYQVLNQANMKIIQTMNNRIQDAAEKVAKDKKLTMIINRDACFFFTPGLDITNLVIATMDNQFDHDVAHVKDSKEADHATKK